MSKIYQLKLNIEKYCWEHTATFYSDDEYDAAASKHDPYDPTIRYFCAELMDRHGRICSVVSVETVLSNLNNELKTKRDKYLVCKECGKVFLLTSREAAWFKEQDLQPPKRCIDCRKKNRSHNKNGR